MTAVMLTRPADSDEGLAVALTGQGLDVVSVPTIETKPVRPGGELDAAVGDLDRFDWVVVTSATGVRAVAAAARRRSVRLAAARPRWAVVGPATGRALEAVGVTRPVVPGRSRGSALATALSAAESLTGRRVLVPRADIATPELPDALRAAGADVVEVVAYRTIEGPAKAMRAMSDALDVPDLAAVVVASGSAVRGLLALATAIDGEHAGHEHIPGPGSQDSRPRGAPSRGPDGAARRVRSLALVSIGPATSEAARAAGLQVAAEAENPTTAALVAAVLKAVGRAAQPDIDDPLPLAAGRRAPQDGRPNTSHATELAR